MKSFSILSIVIPVFNEENYIKKAVEKVLRADASGLKKEIIIVDDGSTDSSKLKVKSSKLKFQKKFPKLKIITIFKTKNEGKGAALKSGFLKSTGDIVLVQDADLEYNPGDYPSLLEPFLSHSADALYRESHFNDAFEYAHQFKPYRYRNRL